MTPTKEQREIAKAIGLDLDEFLSGLKEDCNETPPMPIVTPASTISKAVFKEFAYLVQTECLLCKTVSTRIFKMETAGTAATSKETTLDQVEGLTTKTRQEKTLTCPACRDVLSLMSKEDLIGLILRVAKGENRLRIT